MSDERSDPEQHPSEAVPTQEQHDDLEALSKKLKAAREEAGLDPQDEPAPMTTSGLGYALRIGIEFVVAVVIGGGIGWFLDGQLGTQPWLFLLFAFFGLCAGFLNVVRMAGRMGNTE